MLKPLVSPEGVFESLLIAPSESSTRFVTKLLVIFVLSRGVFSAINSTAPRALFTMSRDTLGCLPGEISTLNLFLDNLRTVTSSNCIFFSNLSSIGSFDSSSKDFLTSSSVFSGLIYSTTRSFAIKSGVTIEFLKISNPYCKFEMVSSSLLLANSLLILFYSLFLIFFSNISSASILDKIFFFS